MPTLADIRAQHPEYNDLSDDALAKGLHSKFYADMPEDEFKAKIGLGTEPSVSPAAPLTGVQPQIPEGPDDRPPERIPTAPEATYKDREAYKTFVAPFNPMDEPRTPYEKTKAAELAKRPYTTRAADTAAFLASLPVRMLTRGEYGAGDVADKVGLPGGDSLNAHEAGFAKANEPQLGAFQALGEIAPGTMGLPVPELKIPRIPEVPTSRAMADMPPSGPTRAQAYVRDLDELGIHKHGPAVAQAAREGAGPGNFSKVIEGFPFVGRPLQKSTEKFVTSGARAGDDIAQGYGSGNIESAGSGVKSYLDKFANKRSIAKDDLDAMPDDEIYRLAQMEPRDIGSMKTAADARYEAAWRQIPEQYRKGAAFAEDPRLMGDMPNTRALIKDIHDDNVRMMNKQRRQRELGKVKADAETGEAIGTRQGAAIKTAIPFRGGVLGTAAEDILAGNWKGSLQTMRNLRTLARRQASAISDTEGNVGNKGNFEQLKKAIDADMQALMERVPNEFRKAGNEPMAADFERAAQGFRSADQFYKQHAEAFDKLKSLMDTDKNPAVIKKLIDAAKKGTGGDAELLHQFRSTASPQVMDDVAASAMVEMGRPTGRASGITQDAQWSPSKFANAWNNMNHEAIFGHRPELYAKLKKYANISQGMADYEALANSSRSGTHNLIGTILVAGPFALLASLKTVLMTGAANYGAARWLASPAYVDWLTQSTRLQKSIAKGQLSGPQAVSATRRSAVALQELVAKDGNLNSGAKADLLRSLALAQQQQASSPGAPQR